MNIMNISLALLHKDNQYRNCFLHAFNEFYPQTEVHTFTNIDIMTEALSMTPSDILLISEDVYNIEKDNSKLGNIRCKALIILTKGRGINKLGSYPAVCQYQMVDNLYQEIINIYADHTDAYLDMTAKTGRTKVFSFISGAGGSGCSSAAAAYSVFLASKGNKVIYIDMSSLGVPEMMLDGEGSYTLTDCFTAVLSKRNNLNVQLETYTRKDSSGVRFYSSCVNSLDWEDIALENKTEFLNCLISDSSYDYVMIDLPPEWNETSAFAYDKADKFFVVTNGSIISNGKCKKLLDTIFTYFHTKNTNSVKIKLLYSDYSDSSVKLQDNRIDEFTVLPHLTKFRNMRDMLKNLSTSEMWER